MFQDELDKVETPAIAQLQRLGWRYVRSIELSPEAAGAERACYRDVVLVGRLERGYPAYQPLAQ